MRGSAFDPSDLDRPRRRRLYRPHVLPTLLTLGNLFCGFLAIAYAADAMAGEGVYRGSEMHFRVELLARAGWMIFLGMVFDALDGSVARLSGGTSPLGAQLDSLADVVTFGAAPAALAKAIAEGAGGMGDRRLTLFFSVFFLLMAALRLARYNVHHGDPEEAQLWFEGLPTPGAAGVVAGLAILLPDQQLRPDGAVLRFLPFVVVALGLLMISRLPFLHFINRFLRGRRPIHHLVVGLFVLVLSLAYNFQAVLASALLAYALSGPIVGLFRRRRRRERVAAGREGGKE